MLPGLPLLIFPEPKRVQGGGFEDLSGLPKINKGSLNKTKQNLLVLIIGSRVLPTSE